ncbi:peptidase M24 [Sistotremastrum suecicum HHB10207 ss-3]|uniref:Peptidase M24 n=1 Tax=Sistotremastrum suecicum HHB10207 ss-3 TaxID=1314776 RepID=A0A166AQG2_9AGAM|nr:peptidase M24 [Sistotremastrum suecicum HHB10207 ss-3]
MLRRCVTVGGKRISVSSWSKRRYATEVVSGISLNDGAPTIAPIKPSLWGQPTYKSHPTLLRPNELTPGITSEEYERRRAALMNGLPDNSIVILVAGSVKYMSQRTYSFRQASDFWYLTGFQEPDTAVILEKNSSSRGYKMTMFCGRKHAEYEKWNGPRSGFEAAISIFGADDARDIIHFPSHLKSVVTSYSNVYVDVPASKRRRSLLQYLSNQVAPKTEYESIIDALSSSRRRPLASEIIKLRTIKSPAEKRMMRLAADISGNAHADIMRFGEPGRSEADIAAHFQYRCLLNGAQRLAYVPVVASGPNALIIHYTANDQLINSDELVLVDAGCEYNGYASDITRTWPASGKFTAPQRDLYQAILNAQKQCIDLCTGKSGLSLHDLHRRSCQFLSTELRQIGFELHTGDLERILYPHFLTHPIGIDLHESSIDRADSIKSGMVITIEPGLYVPPDPRFPKHFHNIGIRIEDEVLVEQDYPVVLSVNAPKEIVDVEGACQGVLDIARR